MCAHTTLRHTHTQTPSTRVCTDTQFCVTHTQMQVYTYVHTLLLVLPKQRQPGCEAIQPNKRDGRENGNSKVPVRRKKEKKALWNTAWLTVFKARGGRRWKDLRWECTKEVSAAVGPCWLPHRTNPARLQTIKNELIWLEMLKFGLMAQFTNKWGQIT